MKKREKLVRDKMPALCRTTLGWTPMSHRYAFRTEMPVLLAAKLLEESQETIKAFFESDKTSLTEELADLQEVLLAIQDHAGISSSRVEAVRQKKFDKRGGFSMGVVWDGNK